MNPIKKAARTASLYYLLVALFGGFAHFSVRLQLIVPDDARATAHNILTSEALFRYGFMADMVQLTFFTLLLLALYTLFKTVHPGYARAMFTLALLGVPIAALNMLHQYAVLFLIEDASYLEAFGEDQRYALSLFLLELHDIGYAIAHIFFGLWLYPLGYLVYRSGFFPKFIGVCLMIAPLGYLSHVILGFVLPKSHPYTEFAALFSGIVEMLFMISLLVLGFKKTSGNLNLSS
ncbi:DUF4386 domain-containing protein [Spongiimicrobium salis]|uniref:DUF4386 domain-containing protein n=1 Tax=Spongiimicrobium salis TaxID=1667022 RepID=UPI00374D2B81